MLQIHHYCHNKSRGEKNILYSNLKLPSITCVFTLLFQHKAFTYKSNTFFFILEKNKATARLVLVIIIPVLYSTSMADKSCSSSDFSEGRSCDSGVVGPSDAQLRSAAAAAAAAGAGATGAAAIPASWVSVSAASTSLLFPQ